MCNDENGEGADGSHRLIAIQTAWNTVGHWVTSSLAVGLRGDDKELIKKAVPRKSKTPAKPYINIFPVEYMINQDYNGKTGFRGQQPGPFHSGGGGNCSCLAQSLA